MPSPSVHTSHFDTQQHLGQEHHLSSRPSSQPWKSVFRFPNSSRKAPSSSSSLALDTSLYPNGNVTHTLTTGTPSLTPTSFLSDPRSSYNSSNTQSSDSNAGLQSRAPFMNGGTPNRSYPTYELRHQKSTDALSIGGFSRPRTLTKSEKQRLNPSRNPTSPRAKPLTADPSQASFQSPTLPSKAKVNAPTSPRSMGASATRFIRRVASAPNAKGLFSLGSRSTSTTKNGLLAPSEIVPPMPGLTSSSFENGTDSLETMSSGSSRGRPSPRLGSPSKTRNNNGNTEGGGQVAFRRTYSSNSIKVRQVDKIFLLHSSPVIVDRISGRSRAIKFPQS
jgi:protein-serine/threonine kinase